MKRNALILCLSILIAHQVAAQEPLTYSEVIKVDSVSKDQLYSRAKSWFADSYRSANDVIQMASRADGQIIGKANLKYAPSVFMSSDAIRGYIRYTIKIFVKDGRYKYSITDFRHDPSYNRYGNENFGLITTDEVNPNPNQWAVKWSNKVWLDMKTQIADHVRPLISSMKAGMTVKADSPESDDW